MVVISVFICGVKMIRKFWWESGFLRGVSMEPPFCTNGSVGYLMQLSVKACGHIVQFQITVFSRFCYVLLCNYIILDGIEGCMRIYCTRHDDIHRAGMAR